MNKRRVVTEKILLIGTLATPGSIFGNICLFKYGEVHGACGFRHCSGSHACKGKVIDYMAEEGIDFGYAEFWDANRICAMSDGKITMGHSLQIEQLQMYWWLTSTEWYVPNLPEDMRTAYVVRQEDKEAFPTQFGETVFLELGFENEKFAVYISDKNLVRMQ